MLQFTSMPLCLLTVGLSYFAVVDHVSNLELGLLSHRGGIADSDGKDRPIAMEM